MDKNKSTINKTCAVKNCPGKNTKRIRTYGIPHNDIDAWCTNLKLDPTKVTSNTRVCSRHFEKECLYTVTLKKGSRPTLNLGHDDYILENEELRDYRSGRLCCIVGCHKTSPPNILYGFPTNKLQLKEWLSNCVLKAETVKHKRKWICGDHFDPSMVHGRILKRNAIPKKDTRHKRSEVQQRALRLLGRTGKEEAQVVERFDPFTDCVVKNCPGKDSDTIALYKIPEDDIDAYCALLNMKPSSVTPSTRICSRHFEQKFLRLTKVSKGARPTLHLGNKGFVLPSLEPLKPVPNKLRCCIVGCDTTSPPHHLFMFPVNEERMKQWIAVCNIKEGKSKKSLRICAKHFDPSMIVDQRLKRDAIPKMEVKQNNTDEQIDTFQTCFEDSINDECASDNDSDMFDGLECKSSCRTCVEVLRDCEKYREHFFALEVALQEEQENFEALKYQNEQLMAELEARMIM